MSRPAPVSLFAMSYRRIGVVRSLVTKPGNVRQVFSRGLLVGALLPVIVMGLPLAFAAAEDTSECLMLLGKDGNYMLCGNKLTKLPSTLKGKASSAPSTAGGTGYGRVPGHGNGFGQVSDVRQGSEGIGQDIGSRNRHSGSDARFDQGANYPVLLSHHRH